VNPGWQIFGEFKNAGEPVHQGKTARNKARSFNQLGQGKTKT
jgi:hypothetical protein